MTEQTEGTVEQPLEAWTKPELIDLGNTDEVLGLGGIGGDASRSRS